MNNQIIQELIYTIENMKLEHLREYPNLERFIPVLYKELQQEEICSHIFIDGKCICGAEKVDNDNL